MPEVPRRKLIEVALPLEKINLEGRRPYGIEVQVRVIGDQPVEAAHRLPRLIRIVVRVRRPCLIGPQHVPRADQRVPQAHTEALGHHADRAAQEPDPFVAVVRGPRIGLRVADGDRVEGTRTTAFRRRTHPALTDAESRATCCIRLTLGTGATRIGRGEAGP